MTAAAGDRAGANKNYEEGFALANRMVAADPSNIVAQRDAAIAGERVGNTLLSASNPAGARKAYEAPLDSYRRLAATDPSNAAVQRNVALAQGKIGDVRAAAKDWNGAQTTYEDSLEFLIVLRRTIRATLNS